MALGSGVRTNGIADGASDVGSGVRTNGMADGASEVGTAVGAAEGLGVRLRGLTVASRILRRKKL